MDLPGLPCEGWGIEPRFSEEHTMLLTGDLYEFEANLSLELGKPDSDKDLK